MHYHQAEKETQPVLIEHIKEKRSSTLIVVGWDDSRAVYIDSSKRSEPKRLTCRLNKRVYSKNPTKLVPLL